MQEHLEKQIDKAVSTLTQGLVRICSENPARPLSFSASFVFYQLGINPIIAADHICRIVQRAVDAFNKMDSPDYATYQIEEPDVEITISAR